MSAQYTHPHNTLIPAKMTHHCFLGDEPGPAWQQPRHARQASSAESDAERPRVVRSPELWHKAQSALDAKQSTKRVSISLSSPPCSRPVIKAATTLSRRATESTAHAAAASHVSSRSSCKASGGTTPQSQRGRLPSSSSFPRRKTWSQYGQTWTRSLQPASQRRRTEEQTRCALSNGP